MHTPTTTHPDDVPASEIRAILKRRFGPGADLPAKAPWPWGAKSEIEEEGKAPTDAIPTGFPDLDRVLGGLRPGWIHTFASESGSGASTLALNLVRRSVDGIQVEGGLRRHPKIALYTPRTRKDIVLLRLVSAMARVDPHRVVTGDLTALDQLRLEGARSSLATLEEGDPRFHDGYGLGVENLHRLVRALRIGAKIDVLVIDGVDALENDGMGEPLLRSMETLKGLACDLCLPVVVTSRLRTVGRSPWDGVPGIPDLLPAVALVSDSVIVLHRPFSPWRPGGPERPDPQSDKGLELVEARRVHPRRGGPSLAHLAFNVRLARFDTIRWDM